MPTDPTTAERFPTIADGPVTETKPAPDYRAALEELLAVAELAGSHAAFFGDDRAQFDAALTHARKVLHGQ